MIIEFLSLGVIVGFVSGFFGVGGGTILVPALLYLGLDIKYAIGISVMQMVFSSILGSYLNYKKGSLKVTSGIYIGAGGFLGAMGSGFVVDTLSSQTLSYIFLGAVLFAIYKFFAAPVLSHKEPIENPIILFAIGCVVGIFAISIGIGGALLIVPIAVAFLYFDVKKAVSTALFFVIFSSISGFISLSYYGYIDYTYGSIVGVSSLFGVYLGIKVAHKTHAKRHKSLILALNFVILGLIINKIV